MKEHFGNEPRGPDKEEMKVIRKVAEVLAAKKPDEFVFDHLIKNMRESGLFSAERISQTQKDYEFYLEERRKAGVGADAPTRKEIAKKLPEDSILRRVLEGL